MFQVVPGPKIPIKFFLTAGVGHCLFQGNDFVKNLDISKQACEHRLKYGY